MAVPTKVAAENDLSLTQLRVLAILRDRRGTMTALAAHLGLDRSTVTGLVDRAQRRGLLARAPNADDGRATDVFLTRRGARSRPASRRGRRRPCRRSPTGSHRPIGSGRRPGWRGCWAQTRLDHDAVQVPNRHA